MRHAAVTLARRVRERIDLASDAAPWDLLFASDMLSMAELRGLLPRQVAGLPMVLYFHESQLDYPDRFAHRGDLHFAMTNFTSALAADAVWFNSSFHLNSFLSATQRLLEGMPDHRLLRELDALRDRCEVHHPGVHDLQASASASRCDASGEEDEPRDGGAARPLRIVWAARWEHDKNPEGFFAALRRLKHELGMHHPNVEARSEHTPSFRLVVLGASARQVPDCFAAAADEFADVIDEWGFEPVAERYLEILAKCDVFVSTARHEFFGISAAEALCAGCAVLLPRRLAYPELLSEEEHWLYESEEELVARLVQMAHAPTLVREEARAVGAQARRRFAWSRRGPDLDAALEHLPQPRPA